MDGEKGLEKTMSDEYECSQCDQKITKSDGLHCKLDPDDLNPLCPKIVAYGEKEKDHE